MSEFFDILATYAWIGADVAWGHVQEFLAFLGVA